MTDNKIISIIHAALQNRDKWYLDHSISEDCTELQVIVEKAKEYADYKISELSVAALNSRYKRWRKEEPQILDGDKYFTTFLSAVAFDLGANALDSQDKVLYWEGCNLHFNFLKS